jgi:hypothetical protein
MDIVKGKEAAKWDETMIIFMWGSYFHFRRITRRCHRLARWQVTDAVSSLCSCVNWWISLCRIHGVQEDEPQPQSIRPLSLRKLGDVFAANSSGDVVGLVAQSRILRP